jgi:hypothetical protein
MPEYRLNNADYADYTIGNGNVEQTRHEKAFFSQVVPKNTNATKKRSVFPKFRLARGP